jgi:hypothetical protein
MVSIFVSMRVRMVRARRVMMAIGRRNWLSGTMIVVLVGGVQDTT